MTAPAYSRRTLLASAVAAGVGVTFLSGPAAAAAGGAKLVVVVARGALDGLSVAPPVGDPDYAALRGALAISPSQALPLDGAFGLHPRLKSLHGLLVGGQARIAPAAALPQRIRSHFEAQDLLETGGAQLYATSTGWLNRALQSGSKQGALRALSIGAQEPLILRGPVQIESWSPGGRMTPAAGRVAGILKDLYADDALLGPALAAGLSVEDEAQSLGAGGAVSGRDVRAFAETAARFLSAPGGPSVAVLSVDGFDTHARQGAAEGQLANRLTILDDVIEGIHQGLGPQWSRTVVIVATEFGRTARANGTGGTDHGTASTLILAGGALRPGGLLGDWPGLSQGKLFEDRDLAPTLDVRSVFKGVLRDHLGVDPRHLDAVVFPGSLAAPATTGLIA